MTMMVAPNRLWIQRVDRTDPCAYSFAITLMQGEGCNRHQAGVGTIEGFSSMGYCSAFVSFSGAFFKQHGRGDADDGLGTQRAGKR